MKRLLSALLFCCLFCSAAAQDTLNQFDSKGRKHGKWMVYLDAKTWARLEDSSKAGYYRYTWYDHGTNLYPMGPCGKKNYTLEHATEPGKPKPRMQLLDGEYVWFDDKGRISSVHNFKEGEYVSCKEFYTSGTLHQHFDYTKKWEDQEHSWTIFIYDKKGNLVMTSYMRKDKNGKWPVTRG